MTPLDVAGHAGYICLFLGSQLLARQNKVGWLLRLAGELIWAVIGFTMGMTSIWIWAIIFIFTNDVYGYWKWRKKEKEDSDVIPWDREEMDAALAEDPDKDRRLAFIAQERGGP